MKNKTKYAVMSPDGLHEYDIKVNINEEGIKTFRIFLSDAEQWVESARGELQLTMADHGDGIIFEPELKDIDYSMLTCVRLLMGIERELDENPKNKEKYKIIKLSKAIKL